MQGKKPACNEELVVASDWLLSVVQEPFARLHLTACTAESNQWLLLRVLWGRARSWLIFSGTLKTSERSGRCHRELAAVVLHSRRRVWTCGLCTGNSADERKSLCLIVSFVCSEDMGHFCLAWGTLKTCVLRRAHGKRLHQAVTFLPQNKSRGTRRVSSLYLWTYMRAAASRIRRRSCRLSSGVSACSVTTTPGVSLITEGSKEHELHSSGGSLQTPEKQLLL